MKKYLIILTLFVCSIGVGQEYRPIYKNKDGLMYLNKDGLMYQASNTLVKGLILDLISSNISKDSLTYNSSGNLVTAFSGLEVDLDGNSEVVVGNSVRFGVPGSGTIYQVDDTRATPANLTLDQTFTGSITDEYYWGGINTWYDESDEGNNLTQPTAINQPKLLWANTDSSEIITDNINDYLIGESEPFNLNDFSLYMNINIPSAQTTSDIVRKRSGADQGFVFLTVIDNSMRLVVDDEFNNVVDQTVVDYDYTGDYIHLILTVSLTDDEAKIYVDGVQFDGTIDLSSITGSIFNDRDITFFGNVVPLGASTKKIRYYNRVLSAGEIKALSE